MTEIQSAQHNDIQHTDTQLEVNQRYGPQDDNIRHNDYLHDEIQLNDTHLSNYNTTFRITTLSIMLLTVECSQGILMGEVPLYR